MFNFGSKSIQFSVFCFDIHVEVKRKLADGKEAFWPPWGALNYKAKAT